MKSWHSDILDNNPFNDPEYVAERLKKDGVRISPLRDIVDEEDYLEMLPQLLSRQNILEQFIKESNLKVSVEEASRSFK